MPTVTWSKEDGSRNRSFYQWRQGKKQTPFVPSIKPPLPYEAWYLTMLDDAILPEAYVARPCGTIFWGEIVPTHCVTAPFGATSVGFNTIGNQVYARAYAKFKGLAYTQAASLTALKERMATFNMVAARLGQLVKGVKALKRGRFQTFLNTFGIRPLKKHENTRWTRPKQFGSLWLEYWMGWAPTVGDVYNCLDALSGRIPDHTIRAGSAAPFRDGKTQSSSGATARSNYEGTSAVWVQGVVEVTNPSLHLAQTIGLVNPVLTMWETTPFSWFLDWFTNVGQVLSQLTDWVGLKLRNLIVSAKTVATSSWRCFDARYIFGWTVPATLSFNKEFFWFTRHPVSELPYIRPILRLPVRLSLSRAATSASLLMTLFAPKKR